jgi:hypothetical protein
MHVHTVEDRQRRELFGEADIQATNGPKPILTRAICDAEVRRNRQPGFPF